MNDSHELAIEERGPSLAYPRLENDTRPVTTGKSLIIIFTAAAVAIVPIAFMGIPDGFDLLQHIRFAAVYYDSMLSGNLFPGWAAEDNYGFGSIGIRYYPPLAYYVLALTKMVTGSWYDSFWITSFGWMFLGSAGIYAWLREWTKGWQPTVAAVIYILAPYHTFQIYQAVLYAEFAAAGIIPWCFLFLNRICRRRRWIDVALFAVCYSLLILTHIPSTIIASASMAVYGLCIYDWKKFVATTVKIGSAVGASILATSFHLAKAVSEMGWVLHNTEEYFANGYYDYKRYFFPIVFSSTPTRYVERMLWLIDALNILTLLLLIPAIAVLIWKRSSKRSPETLGKYDTAIVIAGSFSVFMLSSASSILWNSVVVLQKVQFPWRWMITASLFGSAAFAMVIQQSLQLRGSVKKLMGYLIMGFVLVLVLFNITQNIIPSTPLPRADFEQQVLNMNNEEACPCWWPIWADRRAFDTRERAFAGSRGATVLEWQPESRRLSVEDGEATQLRIATFYHPHWKAMVNEQPVKIGNDEHGAIVVPLPSNTATVKLEFSEPSLLYAAKIVSVMIWLMLGSFLTVYFFRYRINPNAI